VQRDHESGEPHRARVAKGGWRSIGRAGLLWALGLVGAATGVTVAVGLEHLSEADIVMIYLAVIMLCAARFGRGPAVLAAALSVLAFDFFFVAPFHTLSVQDPRNLLTFVMLSHAETRRPSPRCSAPSRMTCARRSPPSSAPPPRSR
jgi:K+-sensing histidine kinase KdpD